MKIFKKTDTLSIYLFDRVIDTGDYGYMIDGYSEGDNVDGFVIKQLAVFFNDIMTDYIIGTGSKEAEMKIKSKISIKILDIELKVVSGVLSMYDNTRDSRYLDVLNKASGFLFDSGKDVDEQVEAAKKRLSSSYTKLSMKKNQYSNKQEKNTEKTSIYETAISMSRTLSLGYSINLKNTSVAEWISYINICKKQAEYA